MPKIRIEVICVKATKLWKIGCIGYENPQLKSIHHFIRQYYKTCVRETRMPLEATNQKYGNIFKSYILTPPQPWRHICDVSEVSNAKMSLQSKFGYCMTT